MMVLIFMMTLVTESEIEIEIKIMDRYCYDCGSDYDDYCCCSSFSSYTNYLTSIAPVTYCDRCSDNIRIIKSNRNFLR